MDLTTDPTMAGWTSALLDLVSRNSGWAPWVVAVLAAMESLAVVSFVVPSSAVLVGVGALVAAGSIDFGPVWLGAVLGAAAGTTLSWWVGYAVGPAILSAGPLGRHPGPVERARGWFERWGIAAVFLGHVFAPVTSMVFLLAGVARVSFLRFQAANLPGAMVWAFFLPKAGEIGASVAAWLWSRLAGG